MQGVQTPSLAEAELCRKNRLPLALYHGTLCNSKQLSPTCRGGARAREVLVRADVLLVLWYKVGPPHKPLCGAAAVSDSHHHVMCVDVSLW